MPDIGMSLLSHLYPLYFAAIDSLKRHARQTKLP